MKANLDLTQHRDFDPTKFKDKEVRAKYNDGYSLRRVPWSNKGDVLSKHSNIYGSTYWYIDDIFNNSWTSPTLSTNIANIYSQLVDYNMTNNTVFTSTLSYNNIDMYYNSLKFRYVKQSGLRIGKVKDIRYTRYMNDYTPAYLNNKRAYCDRAKSSDDRDYDSYKIHRKIKDGYNPNNYDPKYYSVDIRDDFNIEEDQGINLIDKRTDTIGMLARKRLTLSNSGRRRHHTPYEDKFRVVKKMKWFDEHDEYLREMEGNTTWHQWRGITDKNYNRSNDDTRLTLADNWSTVSASAV